MQVPKRKSLKMKQFHNADKEEKEQPSDAQSANWKNME